MINKKIFLISSDYIGGTVTFFYQNFEFLNKKKIQTYLFCNKSPQTKRFNNKNKIFFFKNLINNITFRNILEKTSTFLGYSRWGDLLPQTNNGMPNPYETRIINISSHSKHAGEEVTELTEDDKRVLGYLMEQINKIYYPESRAR